MIDLNEGRLRDPHVHVYNLFTNDQPLGFNVGDWWNYAGVVRRCIHCGRRDESRDTPEHAEAPVKVVELSHQHQWRLVQGPGGGYISYDMDPPLYDWECACGATQRAPDRETASARLGGGINWSSVY